MTTTYHPGASPTGSTDAAASEPQLRVPSDDDPTRRLDTVVEEVRYSLVMFGGVSLAIYISGTAIEFFHLVRGSRSRTTGLRDDDADPTAPLRTPSIDDVYAAVASLSSTDLGRLAADSELAEKIVGGDGPALIHHLLRRRRRRRLTVDVLSGTSAGGLNAIFLAKALTQNVEPSQTLRHLWRRHGGFGERLDRTTGAHSLFNGYDYYDRMLDALQGMSRDAADSLPDQPADQLPDQPADRLVDALDVYLTATNLRGVHLELPIDGHGGSITEARHRSRFHLRYAAPGHGVEMHGSQSGLAAAAIDDFGPGADAFLAFAGRATSAHPAAFTPVQLRDVRRHLANGRADGLDIPISFENRIWPRPSGAGGTNAPMTGIDEHWFSDGGDMDNKPFGYALEPILMRRSSIPVDRKVLYIEPSPDKTGPARIDPINAARARPRLPEYVFGAFTLGRLENIRADVEQIEGRNRQVETARLLFLGQVRELQELVESEGIKAIRGLSGDVDWPTEVALSRRLREAGREPEAGDIEQLRSQRTRRAGTWIGGADSKHLDAYRRRRYDRTIRDLTDMVSAWRSLDPDDTAATANRRLITELAHRIHPPTDTAEVRAFLVKYDLSYRIRRLGFIDQVLSDMQRELIHRGEGADAPLRTDHESGAASGAVSGWFGDMAHDRLEPTLRELTHCRLDLNRAFNRLRAHGRSIRNQEWSTVLGIRLRAAGWSVAKHRYDSAARYGLPADGLPDDYFEPLSDYLADVLESESALSRLAIARVEDPTAGGALRTCWTCFDWFDRLALEIWHDIQGEIDPAEVVRLSPHDATEIINTNPRSPGPPRRKMGGAAFAHFGGFFDDRWRMLDLMWGRLDAAEIVLRNLLPDPARRSGPSLKWPSPQRKSPQRKSPQRKSPQRPITPTTTTRTTVSCWSSCAGC